ncbi:PH domain-containing protein [Corynebacterium gerontici]|nr:PH domain-containing protein [Corynebacterium gerontici]
MSNKMSEVDNINQRHRELSEEELQRYVAADAALTSSKPWKLSITSRKLRIRAMVSAGVIIALHVFLALVVAIGDTGTTVTVIDQWGYFLVGVLLAALVFIALWRPRVQVNEDGVEVRNFLGTKFYPWFVIYGLNFPEGARMARLELPDFEYVSLWALQSADGAQAVQDVKDFRALEAQYMPED